jgi:hypothetical protein
MVNTKAIKTAMILRLFIGPTPLGFAESVHEVKGCGSKDRDKECREQETGKWEEQLHGSFLRSLFRPLPALGPK